MPVASAEERIGTSDEPPVEGETSARRTRRRAVRYGVSVAAVALALLLQVLLIPLFGVSPNASPFMVFFAAIIVAAWFGGLGPGLWATALSALLSWYFFLSPRYSFAIISFGQGLRLVVFVLEGAVISLLVEAMHSARRRAEVALEERSDSEERYRAVVKQSADGIYLVDGESRRILETNPALQKMLGYTAEELRGMELYEIVAHDRQSVEANVERTLRKGRRFIRERRYRRKDGSEVDVEVAASAISYAGKQVICAAIRDITERKRAEQAMREIRDAERSRLARDLHDGVLQDLSYTTAALGVIMLEAERTTLEEELQRAVDALRRATQELRDAVYDLRLKEELDRPFLELAESLVQRNRPLARGCEISLVVGEGFPSAPLGETGAQLLRIIQEALTNARRHSGAKNVVVSVGMDGSDLVTEISDDGRGFEREIASGVGLNSMRERAAAIGATLEIESKVGQGTRVRLRVPIPQEG